MLIRDLLVDDETEDKLWFEHEQLTQLDVEEALDNLEFDPRWDVDVEHGGRVIALGKSQERGLIFISMSPIDLGKGSWQLISAFECTLDYWQRIAEDKS